MLEWYIEKEEFNAARTTEEATHRFAADRQRTYNQANESFNKGVGLGVRICVVVSIIGLTLLAFT
jgi:hypothetical protein